MRTAFAILISILTLLYLLPFGIAFARRRTNTTAIFFLNLFLGWTCVGWVVSLVWSMSYDALRHEPPRRA